MIATTVSDIPLPLLLLALEFPAITALVDCVGRPADDFEGGESDRKGWIGWLVVAIVTVPVLVGYGLLIGYYFSVIRRNTPGSS